MASARTEGRQQASFRQVEKVGRWDVPIQGEEIREVRKWAGRTLRSRSLRSRSRRTSNRLKREAPYASL